MPLFEPLAGLLRGGAPAGWCSSAGRWPRGASAALKRGFAGGTGGGVPARLARASPGGGAASAADRHRLRDALLREAGATRYDLVEGEFRALAGRLGWPEAATLKDLRHLFGTGLANAGMPEPYRQYLMGHAPSSAAVTAYTHLNQVREQYLLAVEREWGPLVAVLAARASAAGWPAGTPTTAEARLTRVEEPPAPADQEPVAAVRPLPHGQHVPREACW